MAAKASISSGYRWRLGIIAAALLAFGAWFLYDGAVKYPEQKRIYETRIELEQEHPDEWRVMWADMVDAQGWPENPTERTDRDIFVQFLCAGITIPLGLVFGISWVRTASRWIAADDEGLHTSWGQHALWPTLRSVDKTRWKAKGIAVVHYDDNGTERRITLDDWKYDREPTNDLLKQVENHLGEGEPDSTTDPTPETAAAPQESDVTT